MRYTGREHHARSKQEGVSIYTADCPDRGIFGYCRSHLHVCQLKSPTIAVIELNK